MRLNHRKNEISAKLAEMALKEPQWAESNLLSIARTKFVLLQNAWGEQDLDTIKRELNPNLYVSWEMDIQFQNARNERNVMIGLSIADIRIVSVKNYIDDEKDEFTVAFDACAIDQIIKSGIVTSSDDKPFREFWTFEWKEGEWVLKEVAQAEGWKRFVNAAIVYEKIK